MKLSRIGTLLSSTFNHQQTEPPNAVYLQGKAWWSIPSKLVFEPVKKLVSIQFDQIKEKMAPILIKNGTVVNADHSFKASAIPIQ